MEFKIIEFDSLYYWGILRLREIVLRLPLNRRFSQEDITLDQHDLICGLYENDQLIASCQFKMTANEAKMRQVATSFKHQKQGYGTYLLQKSEIYLKNSGISNIYCHARVTAVPFYLSQGYKIVSEEFEEVGIPHVKMIKKL